MQKGGDIVEGNLKEHLVALHKGEKVVLRTIPDQFGETVASEWLTFRDGRWLRGFIACLSSAWWGLGTCRCVSHEAVDEVRISRKQMLGYLRQHLREEKQDSEARQAELAWLSSQIETLPD